MASDPQRFNLYAYTRNNPLSLIDPTGKSIELIGDEEERKKMLEAIKAAVGPEASKLLSVKTETTFFGLGKDKYYVDISNEKQFKEANDVSKQIGAIVKDPDKEATIRFDDPGTKIMGVTLGSMDEGYSPGLTAATFRQANLNLTRGEIGSMPGSLMSDSKPGATNLSQITAHELSHVFTTWYKNGIDTNGNAVRIENKVRQIQDPDAPTRVGHNRRGDVYLGPSID